MIPISPLTRSMAFFAAIIVVLCGARPAAAQIEVSSRQVEKGEYVYEMASDPGAFAQAARDWNASFEPLCSNVKAVSETDKGGANVIYLANTIPKEATMEVVMTFDFSQSGSLATQVEGGHWMQSFAPGESQPYYQRLYSINGGKEVLIDQSPSWGEFPNDGDVKATGFRRMAFLGGEFESPVNFSEPAKTFTYKIVVKFQNRKTGEEGQVPSKTVQAVRGIGDPALKREPLVFRFAMQPAKK